jgi:hypothetical protein
MLDKNKKLFYNDVSRRKLSVTRINLDIIRACTGFDGDFEGREAIRRDHVTVQNLNINADNKLAYAA